LSSNNKNIAVIGCGYWGKNIVRNFSELGILAGISDPRQENTAPLAAKYDVPVLSIEEILASEEIEGVAIAAPAPLHAELAVEIIRAGKHVMVEKPVALTLDDAQHMIDEAEKHDRLLMVGHLLNYHNGFLKVVDLVESGALGKLRRIYSNRMSFGKVRTEEDVLWSFAPHDLSMILRLAGGKLPLSVSASGSSYLSSGIADFAHIHMTFESQVSSHVFVSWLHPFKEQKLVVIGDEAMVVFDDTLPDDRKIALYRHKADIVDGIPVLDKADAEYVSFTPAEPLKSECLAFVEGMKDRSSIYTDGLEGKRVLEVLSMADAALKQSGE